MSEPKRVQVKVIDAWGNELWTLHEFLSEVAKIPKEHLETATVELDPTYDDVPKLVVSYLRPQTQAEAAAELESHERYAREQEHRMRLQYEALKARFG